ncbi:MAG: SAM-dependent methyltransferase, partial [Burkholderiales bacterium]
MPKTRPAPARTPADSTHRGSAAKGKHVAQTAQVIEEIRDGQSIELLKELHILTREGKLNQDTRRKLKQVYHLYQFIEPLLNDVFVAGAGSSASLADHGAGKSYLGFILYDLFFNVAHAGGDRAGHVYGIETRAELVDKSRALAQRLGFDRMSFLNLSVQEATTSRELPHSVDIVTALHACDTATDDAIAFGLAKN